MLSTVVSNRVSWTFTGKTRRHTIVFEHNTFSGSRKVYLNGSTLVQSGWKFDLTGAFTFILEPGYTVEIMIKADDLGSLFYHLSVNGKEIIADPKVPRGGGLSSPLPSSSGGLTSPSTPSSTTMTTKKTDPSAASSTGVTTLLSPEKPSSSSSSLFSSFFHSPSSSSSSSTAIPSPTPASLSPSTVSTTTNASRMGEYVWNVLLPEYGLYQIEFFTSTFDILINNIKIDCEGTFADDGPGTVYKIPITQDIYGTLIAIPLSLMERKVKGKDMLVRLTVDTIGEIPESEFLTKDNE